MTKAKIFSKKYAHELLSIAHLDVASARDLQAAKTQRVENIFLLAQQGLEKGLKAVLCWNDQPVPFLHDIGVLVTLVTQLIAPPFEYELNELTEFATIRRYHEGHEEFSDVEIEEILSQVELALQWCRSQLTH